jgi:pilus assembly protein CpaF
MPAVVSETSQEFTLKFKEQVMPVLIQKLDPALLERGHEADLRAEVESLVDDYLRSEKVPLARPVRARLLTEIVDEMVGFGPLEPLLKDESISEIMVNGPFVVYIERKGRIELSEVHFQDEHHVRRVIDKIITPLGRRVDESSPMVDARLPDGSRVNAIIPPLALNGSTITIRKFRADPLKIEDLLRFKALSPAVVTFLQAAVKCKLNIIISGGTGSGKTTMLNCLSSFIPDDERIVTIEDAAELKCQQEHVVRLESRPRNIEGKGEVTIRDLVRNSLRMRPDRIVVGECRGGEALDMLQAMNTGHDGSMTTLHSNTARDCLARMETLVMMAGMDLPQRAIREQIASAVHIIVQIGRLSDGSRRCQSVSEIQGMEGQVITMQDLFKFEQKAVDAAGKAHGTFKGTGIVSKYLDRFKSMGCPISADLFRSVIEV